MDFQEKKNNIDSYVRRRFFGQRYTVRSNADASRLLIENDWDDEKGTIQKCTMSFSYILEYTNVQPKPIWYDSFCNKVMIGDEIRQKHHDDEIKGKLEVFFSQADEKANINKRDVEDAIGIVARRNCRNSFLELVKQFHEQFKGPDDRVEITDLSKTYLCKFLNAEDTANSRMIQFKTGLAMVARLVEPGTYVEGSLGLVGATKAGKTFVQKTLCVDHSLYYFGSKCDLANPWSYGACGNGKVIFDCPESGDLLALDDSFKKQFMDTTHDEYAEKNEKQSTQHPRTWVIWFSTNEHQIITDDTSTRRFWCIEIIDDPNFTLNHKLVQDSVPRLWAEWYQAYLDLPEKSPQYWCSTPEEYLELDKSNQRFKVINSFAEFLKDKLFNRNEISALQIRDLIKLEKFQDVKPISDKRIGETMRNILKWTVGRDNYGRMVYYRPVSERITESNAIAKNLNLDEILQKEEDSNV